MFFRSVPGHLCSRLSLPSPDSGSQYSIYFACKGAPAQNLAGQWTLRQVDRLIMPSPICAEAHARMCAEAGVPLKLGLLRAADADQLRRLQPNSSGMFDSSGALRAAHMWSHASGLCQGPTMHNVKTYNTSAAAKKNTFGTSQQQDMALLDLQKKQYEDLRACANRERMWPQGKQCTALA